MDPVDGPMTCIACCQVWASWRAKGLSYYQRSAMWSRHTKHLSRHPTYKAITAALEALEAVPPGTLDDYHSVLRAVMLGEVSL